MDQSIIKTYEYDDEHKLTFCKLSENEVLIKYVNVKSNKKNIYEKKINLLSDDLMAKSVDHLIDYFDTLIVPPRFVKTHDTFLNNFNVRITLFGRLFLTKHRKNIILSLSAAN